MKTYKILVSGRIQGVGYRNYVKGIAKKYQGKGYVKNTEKGQVEIILQINSSKFKSFIEEIQISQHILMKINTIVYQEIYSSITYQDFSISY